VTSSLFQSGLDRSFDDSDPTNLYSAAPEFKKQRAGASLGSGAKRIGRQHRYLRRQVPPPSPSAAATLTWAQKSFKAERLWIGRARAERDASV